MTFDLTRCVHQNRGCPGRWLEREVEASAEDVIRSMQPMCPDMTTQERAARPLRTIDRVIELTCRVCGQTARRIQYRTLELN